MAKYIVVKAHDGIKEGTVKSLPDSHITRYMVKEGYWKPVEDKDAPSEETEKKKKKKKD